ncbi:MAG: cation:proton antiporter [Holosporaceae bacterium]|jgi:CPA2 family monovalent cation:H+ antiporter-2|nr:cation:proton antiporter [Holosporaceae bacterium]
MQWTVTKIALVILCAMGSGLVLSLLGHTPVLGYIIAGILLGPSGLQLIGDRASVELFSEMGILLLLFVIGLNLSFEKIKSIWKKSFAITLFSTAAIYLVVFAIGYFFKLTNEKIMLIAFCVALSSTAVTVKSLATLKDCDDQVEENTFGILVAQDLVALGMVIIIKFCGSASRTTHPTTPQMLTTLLFIGGLALYFYWYHQNVHRLTNFMKKHADMLTMIVFGVCLGGAVLAEIAGLSAPFGAFVSGLILGNSNMRDKAQSVTAPIEEILLMAFFLSVGLSVDLEFVYDNVWLILLSLIFVAFGKTVINVFVLRLCRFPLKEAFVISVLLGHIGEFSFMLSNLAQKVNIIDSYGEKFLVSLTALSLFLSPFWLVFAERCRSLARNVNIVSSWEFFRLVSDKELIRLRHFKTNIAAAAEYLSNGASELIGRIKSIKKNGK